jgi:hypothetical protein
MDAQSPFSWHDWPPAHGGHEPPQSRSVSSPFWTVSVQLSGTIVVPVVAAVEATPVDGSRVVAGLVVEAVVVGSEEEEEVGAPETSVDAAEEVDDVGDEVVDVVAAVVSVSLPVGEKHAGVAETASAKPVLVRPRVIRGI